MKTISVTKLRAELYATIDQAIQTGIPVEIKRNGHVIRLVPEKKRSKLDNLIPHNSIVGNPDDLITVSPIEWNEEKNLSSFSTHT